MNHIDRLGNAQQNSIKTIKNNVIENVPEYWVKEWLLHVLQQPLSFLITDESYPLTAAEFEQFNAGISKMQQGTPLAYLTGRQEFWSLNFQVNEHTLIPRPDTEVLVEQVLNWINRQPFSTGYRRLLDLGTGSGCIAISLAHELQLANDTSSWQVVAVDLSKEALKVAQANAKLNHIDNIEFIKSSWYHKLPADSEQLFDIIVSNPPYIDESDEHLARLQAEPISALSAPNQGLADINHIVEHAPRYLQMGGLLAIEHGFNQGAVVQQLFIDIGFDNVQTVQDFGGNDRVTLGQLLDR